MNAGRKQGQDNGKTKEISARDTPLVAITFNSSCK
jgi:hypothetical protein